MAVTKILEKHLKKTWQSTMYKGIIFYKVSSVNLEDKALTKNTRKDDELIPSLYFTNKDLLNNDNLFEELL